MADTKKDKNTKKKKKNDLTAMDYITISFTVIIGILMVFIVIRTVNPDLFRKNTDDAAPVYSDSPVYSAAPAATAEPAYSDIGNTYGNMSNDAHVASIDGRTYYTTTDSSGKTGLYVSVSGTETLLAETKGSSLSAVRDPFAFSSIPGATGYTVFFIDGEGKLCSVTEDPFQNPSSSVTMETDIAYSCTAPKDFTDGTFRSALAVGEYMFFIDSEGHIGKMPLSSPSSRTVLSKDTYSSFCVYYGIIYAIHENDGFVYELTTYARPEETAQDDSSDDSSAEVPGVDEYEMLAVSVKASSISVADDWLYIAGDSGISRYDISESFGRDTLSSAPATFINVLNSGEIITYVSDGKIFCCTSRGFLTGDITEVASLPGITALNTTGTSLSDLTVYAFDGASGILYSWNPGSDQ